MAKTATTSVETARLAAQAFWNDLLDGEPSLKLNNEGQLVYWKLAALATFSKAKDGALRIGAKPMTRGYLADRIGCSLSVLESVIAVSSLFENKADRIEVLPDGALRVLGMQKYEQEAS